MGWRVLDFVNPAHPERAAVGRLDGYRAGTGSPADGTAAADRDAAPNADGLRIDLWGCLCRESFSDRVKRFIEVSERATRIQQYAAHVVPGWLQTGEYARAVLRTWGTERLEERLHPRMARQELLHGPDAPDPSVILDESVLPRPVGGRAFMVRQLRHLIDCMAKDI